MLITSCFSYTFKQERYGENTVSTAHHLRIILIIYWKKKRLSWFNGKIYNSYYNEIFFQTEKARTLEDEFVTCVK